MAYGHCYCGEQRIEEFYARSQRCKACCRKALRRYYLKHKAKVLAATKRYRDANPEKVRQIHARKYSANIERHARQMREWRLSHQSEQACYSSNRRARLRGDGGAHTTEEWLALCESFNNACACCGKHKKLTRDHVVPVFVGGSNDISNIQPLCLRCNASKGTKTIDYRKAA